MNQSNPNLLLQFFGLRRSGNHAIGNWLQKNLPYQDLTVRKRHNDVFAPQRRGIRVLTAEDMRVTAPVSTPSMLLVSYEDTPLHLVPHLSSVRNADQILDNANIKRVLLLRDAYNMAASRIELMEKIRREDKTYAINRVRLPQAMNMWKEYAREFLGETNVLGDIIPVNYNRWATDRDYRDELLLTHFGVTNKDLGIEDVPLSGRGSSRDGLSFQGKASEMRTDERWEAHIYDPFFHSTIRDGEVVALSERVFGHIPGTEVFDQYIPPEGVYHRGKEQ